MSATFSKNQVLIGKEYADAVLSLIDRAKSTICVLMYDWRTTSHDFSSDTARITHALSRANSRGVKVRLILNSPAVVQAFSTAGIASQLYRGGGSMHSKVFCFDEEAVILGSHNLTENAIHHNIETSVLLFDIAEVRRLSAFFDSLWLS